MHFPGGWLGQIRACMQEKKSESAKSKLKSKGIHEGYGQKWNNIHLKPKQSPMWVFLLVHFYMFGHDFVLMFMLAHFFKPIRLIACMFGNKSSHLGWVMSSCCNLYFLSITWFFIPLHVKPVGLVFMCMLYDKDMHHLLCMSSPWGHFQIPIWALHLRPANASCI